MKRAVGYIRVSTLNQATKGESLSTQTEAIQSHCKKNNLELIHIYRDEGISGGTVADRPGLLNLLNNINGIDYIIVHRLSRLGRNARELLNNVHELNENGVQIYFIKENLDQSSPYGKMMLTMLAAISEMERDIIGESSRENKVNRCKSGIPSTGRLPFGRKYNKETNEWYYDPPNIKGVIQDVAKRYLNGEPLHKITKDLPISISYNNLRKVLKHKSSSKWTVRFKNEPDPITYNIPPLLDDQTIQKVIEKMEHNRKFNRTDIINRYLLSSFVYCWECGLALHGQTQRNKYMYYRHPCKPENTCKAFKRVDGKSLESAVFKTLFDNIYDAEGFNQAIEDNFEDEGKAVELQEKIKQLQSDLDKRYKKQDEIARAFLDGSLSGEMLKRADRECSTKIDQLKTELTKLENRLSTMPKYEEIREQSEQIRIQLMRYFGSQERLNTMTYDEKRRLLQTIFNGKDHEGTKYGIYIEKIGENQYQYFIYTRFLHGIKMLDNDDPNSDNDPKTPSIKGNNGYKTSNHCQDKISRSYNLKYEIRRVLF